MPDTADAAAALLAAAAQQGPGDTLRIVLLVSMVGGAFLAWFLLRGYRSEETGEDKANDNTGDSAKGKANDPAVGGTDRDANA
jgi:ABC-type microcin C transport system permease subunit YejB